MVDLRYLVMTGRYLRQYTQMWKSSDHDMYFLKQG